MQRACALGFLNNGITIIRNAGKSKDEQAAIEIIKQLGASVKKDSEGNIIIKSTGIISANKEISCGESGLSLRMFTPIVALGNETVVLTGTGSLLSRPVGFFNTVLPELQVSVQSNNGRLPLQVTGPLIPANITIDGSGSSQFLTGLLFAFSKAVSNVTTIKVNELKSKPYIDLSLQMLEHFGYQVENDNYTNFKIFGTENKIREVVFANEGDWSAGAFLLVAGIISGDIVIDGLSKDSLQADRSIIEVLEKCGAEIVFEEDKLKVKHTKDLKAFTFDATDCPDLFPPLVVLASFCNGISTIKGTSRLHDKESNREESLINVFSEMGIEIRVTGDVMIIPGKKIIGGTVDGHHDHRIVMACAVAALGSEKNIIIKGAEAVAKSYPDFFEDLQLLGASVSLR